MIYVLAIVCTGLVVGMVLLLQRLRKAEDNLTKVMEFLSTVAPSLERRLYEGGTQVVLSDRWEDEETYSYDD